MLLFSKHSLGSTICTARRAKRTGSPECCAIVSTQHVILDKSLYLTEPLSLHKMTCLLQPWKDLGLFWFGFFERYLGLCNWQMISCLDMKSHAVNYKRFLFFNPEYLTEWVWSALGKLLHKHWWALTSRTSEEGKEIDALVHKDRISLSPKKTNQTPNTEKPQFLLLKESMNIYFLPSKKQWKGVIFFWRV